MYQVEKLLNTTPFRTDTNKGEFYMTWLLQLLQKKKTLSVLSGLFMFILLFQFNNCGRNNSQMVGNSSAASTATNLQSTPNNQADTPVSARNPYVLQCITSSDGVKVSSKLNLAVRTQKMATNGKLSSLDWNQDEDLIITLDNNCIRKSNYTDSIMNYIKADQIKTDQSLTVYVVKKEDISNLKLFIERANDSECLVTTEKNQQLKIKADVADPSLAYSTHLLSIGATDTFLTELMSYNNSQLYKTKVALVDTGVDYTNPDLAAAMAVDSNGQIIGYNSTTTSTSFTDSGYHGTHVAGLVAAGFHNGIYSSGVYGRNIALYPVRGSNDGENWPMALSGLPIKASILLI
jgi:subtilisin family serine protease